MRKIGRIKSIMGRPAELTTNVCRSYQLKADIPTGGVSSGALVHFTEASMGKNLSTDTPWIAYISCDRNESEASQYWGERGLWTDGMRLIP